ncbi:straightjacket [Carabus blaptoides fortunei]
MKIFFLILCLSVVFNCVVPYVQDDKILQMSKTWADRLGTELCTFGNIVTRKSTVADKYKSADVVFKNVENLTNDIAGNIATMMEQKVAAVERIMDAARNLAVSSSDEVDSNFKYYNAKKLINNLTDPLVEKDEKDETPRAEEFKSNRKLLDPNDNDAFLKEMSQGDERYTEEDEEDDEDEVEGVAKEVIQVSDGEGEILQASQQEAHLPKQDNKTRLNLTENPNFFNIPVNTEHSAVHVPSNVFDGSNGVIQGIKWSEDLDRIFKDNYRADPTLSWQYFGSSTGFMRQFPAMIWHQEPIDEFDCRTRSWFIEAASSPKDIVVLVDRSGSMTGRQKEIAKHVVNNILETLGNNDYVNIFTFSNVTEPVVPCFNDTLVQANLANLRELREHMDGFKTENIANFSDALTVAFRLLENYRIGSRNKSGAGCNQAIMLITDGVQYNYKELFEYYNWKNLPYKPVRVFTYLIGIEVSDVREVKWMACANQGYYVHLSTFAEVREQVLHYIPVMARPMVLQGKKPSPTWSPVYADVTDPKLTNWLWTQRQRRDQKELFLSHRQHPHKHTADTDKHLVHQQKKQDHYGDLQSYTLMTSVSMPVYDRRQNATRVANLLGVAGTDVPVLNIQQLMMPHMIGVNGYAFITTNNGYILIHPDLRPVFQGILKPAYNRVDMAEVELPDDELDPRDFNRTLLEMRKDIVQQRKGKKVMDMKYHVDEMKRLIRGQRYFHYVGIKETPFTLVVSLPDRYGTYHIQHALHKEDIHRQVANKNDISKYFTGDKWKIHPDWIYCKYVTGTVKYNSTEAELVNFLNRMQHEHWKWSHKNTSCDRGLFNSLVFDAKSTNFFDDNITTTPEDKKGHELIKRLGITIAFIATHSGLTRWQDFPQNILPLEANKTRLHFSELHNRAIDEVWYRRAVEQHYTDEGSFVYSVPFELGNDTLVTASHAIFLSKDEKSKEKHRKVPVAVVGYQFYHSALVSFFENTTNRTCVLDRYTCYILDNNGYILLSELEQETGQWFGVYQSAVMKMLVDEGVYEKVQMYDYQAVCFPENEEKNMASKILTPFKHIAQILNWAIGTLLYFVHLVTGNQDYEGTSESSIMSNQPPTKQNEKEFDKRFIIKKTTPTACDKRRWIYELMNYKNTIDSPYNRKWRSDKPFIVQRILYSNLILLVMDNNALKDGEEILDSPVPEEIDYNMTLACRIREDDLPRRRYANCTNFHINESAIELCGKSSILMKPAKLLLILVSVIIISLHSNIDYI